MNKPRQAGDTARDALVGTMLADRYRVDALVDRGAMGRVYVGQHVLMKKRVAIKVMHPELVQVPEFVARFEREAMAAANIDNEHVVAATDFGKLPNGGVFLVLEYLEGKNLRDEIALGPIVLVRSLHIARQITFALRSAHARGIVHRDLKPENVMLVEKAGDSDFVKVLDFGIAKVPNPDDVEETVPTSKRSITSIGMVIGTPEYMAPEQALGQDVDGRADLYSLGVMLYEMLAGVRPFIATSRVGIIGQQLAHSAPPVADKAPGVTVPPAVDRFIHRLLARDASERFQSADAVLEVLDKHLGYAPGSLRVPTLRTGTFSAPPPTLRGASLSETPDSLLEGKRPKLRGEGPFADLSEWVDARRHVLPKPLRSLPAPVILSMPVAVAGLALGFLVTHAVSGRPPTSREAPSTSESALSAPSAAPEAPSASARASPDRAPADDLARASTDPKALDALAGRYPKDPAVWVALSEVALKEKEPSAALQAISQALRADENSRNDARVASALWILAQNKTTSDDAISLLGTLMGARGASILRDLATTEAVRKSVRDHATEVLRGMKKARGQNDLAP